PPHSLRQEGAVTAGLASSLRATRMSHVGIVLSDRSWLDCRSGQPRSACTVARAESSPSRRPAKPSQTGTECWRECGPVCRPLVISSAIRVGGELLANDLLADAGPNVVLETVGQRDEEVVYPLLLDDLGKQSAGFFAVVLTQELTHL